MGFTEALAWPYDNEKPKKHCKTSPRLSGVNNLIDYRKHSKGKDYARR